MIDAIAEAASLLFSWPVIAFAIAGLLIGIVIGMIPGLGPSVGMTIILPFTVVLDGVSAILLLVGVYMGSAYGGSVSAILLNVPGTAASAASTFDGYPMSRQGLALNALAVSATASAIGGGIAVIILFLSAPFVIEIVLAFNSPEYVLIAFFGLAMITIVARGSVVKGLTAGLVGILLATVGIAEVGTDARYTFGSMALYDGVSLVATILGLFAIAEMIKLSGESGGIAKNEIQLAGSIVSGAREVTAHPVTTFKSGLIGTAIGAIPGAGASMANFVSYAEAMRSLNEEDTFGNGDTRGLIASETSNNGAVGGSLIPTLSFGIPGSVLSAILLGALLMHGIQPGPNLYGTNFEITLSIYLALALGTFVVIPVAGLLVVTRLGFITRVNTTYIVPIIIALTFVGGYAIRFNWIDIVTIVVMGIVGYFMVKHGYSIIAFLLGMILGPIAEQNLNRSLQLSDGSLLIFVESSIAKILVVSIVLFLALPVVRSVRNRSV